MYSWKEEEDDGKRIKRVSPSLHVIYSIFSIRLKGFLRNGTLSEVLNKVLVGFQGLDALLGDPVGVPAG